MLRTRTVVSLVLVPAAIVFAIGLPWLFNKHQTPAEYVPNAVATTADIQEFDLMWNHLKSLQRKSAEFGPTQYKQQFLNATTEYLQLDSKQTRKFVTVVDEGLANLKHAKSRLNDSRKQTSEQSINSEESSQADSWSGEPVEAIAARRDAWSQWRNEQTQASDLLLSALQTNPRHRLLAERRLLWLLKLDYSLRTSIE